VGASFCAFGVPWPWAAAGFGIGDSGLNDRRRRGRVGPRLFAEKSRQRA
jgi:hypothetical protein